MVATEEGSLHRIKWNASVNQKASFHIRGFPASLDFHQTKGTETVKRWTPPASQLVAYHPVFKSIGRTPKEGLHSTNESFLSILTVLELIGKSYKYELLFFMN